MTTIPPRESGVYHIRCLPNGKIYVGSAVDLKKRWRAHLNSLRSHDHENTYLQRAWDKYGQANFEFTVLEFVEVSELLQVEQVWIDRTRCTDRSIGFNICMTAGSPLGVKRSPETRQTISNAKAYIWEGFIDPSGNEVTIKHLPKFCRENGLVCKMMYALTDPNSSCKVHRSFVRRMDLT